MPARGLRRLSTSRSSPRSTTRLGSPSTRSSRRPSGSRRRRRRDRPGLRSGRRPGPASAMPCRPLRDAGLRVSIDSFDPVEVAQAVAAGAELVLSVNATNRDAGRRLGRRGRRDPRSARVARRARRDDRVSSTRQGVPFRDRSDPGADRLRLRGVARPLSRGAPPLSRGRDDDGRRQPHRADRRRLGRASTCC